MYSIRQLQVTHVHKLGSDTLAPVVCTVRFTISPGGRWFTNAPVFETVVPLLKVTESRQ
jgi:hypothetical protein